ncbi:VOC family protein [Psychrobacillus sp. FSL K6-4046]|uniref:VOC family protein n=1 Tax=Psychrobacillus sp. FSL K6-4046 TaxID=2921550 RepID=UPI00315AC246
MNKPIENRIDTIFIHVSDLERSIQWYSNLLGIEVLKTNHTGPIYTFNMGENRPGLTLDNHCLDEDYTFIPSNQPLFIFSCTDIEEAFLHVSSMGVEMVTDIIRYTDLSEFSFKDPDGNILMVCTCFS